MKFGEVVSYWHVRRNFPASEIACPECSLLAIELVGVGEDEIGSGSSIAIGHLVGLYLARN